MWKRWSALWLLVRTDARTLWFALCHPQAPAWLKGGTALLLLYLVSPIDLIPDAIPLLGVVDDLVLIPAAVRLMLKYLPPQILAEAQKKR